MILITTKETKSTKIYSLFLFVLFVSFVVQNICEKFYIPMIL
jgi:hypothetical protein